MCEGVSEEARYGRLTADTLGAGRGRRGAASRLEDVGWRCGRRLLAAGGQAGAVLSRVAYSVAAQCAGCGGCGAGDFFEAVPGGAWQEMEEERAFLARVVWRVAVDRAAEERGIGGGCCGDGVAAVERGRRIGRRLEMRGRCCGRLIRVAGGVAAAAAAELRWKR